MLGKLSNWSEVPFISVSVTAALGATTAWMTNIYAVKSTFCWSENIFKVKSYTCSMAPVQRQQLATVFSRLKTECTCAKSFPTTKGDTTSQPYETQNVHIISFLVSIKSTLSFCFNQLAEHYITFIFFSYILLTRLIMLFLILLNQKHFLFFNKRKWLGSIQSFLSPWVTLIHLSCCSPMPHPTLFWRIPWPSETHFSRDTAGLSERKSIGKLYCTKEVLLMLLLCMHPISPSP